VAIGLDLQNIDQYLSRSVQPFHSLVKRNHGGCQVIFWLAVVVGCWLLHGPIMRLVKALVYG
jgi:hypothetical protein